MKTIKVVAAVITSTEKTESQSSLPHSVGMGNSKVAGNFREERSKKEKHHRKH